MTPLMRRLLAAVLACSLAACAWTGGRETYPMSKSDMRDKLAQSALPVDSIGSGGYGLNYRTTKLGDGSLIWTITSDQGRAFVRIKVTFIEVDGGTQFDVDVSGASNKAEEGLAQNPSFRSHFLEFAKEHCDAVLDGRPFDVLAVNARTLPPNSDENDRTAQAMEKSGEAYQREEARNIENAYREEGKGDPWD